MADDGNGSRTGDTGRYTLVLETRPASTDERTLAFALALGGQAATIADQLGLRGVIEVKVRVRNRPVQFRLVPSTEGT